MEKHRERNIEIHGERHRERQRVTELKVGRQRGRERRVTENLPKEAYSGLRALV